MEMSNIADKVVVMTFSTRDTFALDIKADEIAALIGQFMEAQK
jgi:hypothetical protein